MESSGFLLTPRTGVENGVLQGREPNRPATGPVAPAARDALTHVELIWIERRLEHWIRFGRHCHEQIVTRRTRILAFRPGEILALVRWSANEYGTVHSRIDIARAAPASADACPIPFVRPGAEPLLSVTGWSRVRRVLAAIDAIEAAGIDPCEAAPEHWQHVSNRLAAGLEPRLYTRERHDAWLQRKALGQ
jgi:hypothetical protein